MGCQDVDVKFVLANGWVGFGHFCYALVPIRHGDSDAVGLGSTSQMLFRACHSQFKSEFQHAVHTDARHHRFLHHDFTFSAGVHAATNAGILAFGVFAHDVHIDFARCSGRAVFAHHWRDDAGHQTRWTQVDVLVKFTAKQQQRAPQRDVVSNFVGPAYRTKVNGIVSTDLVFPIVGHHLAVLLKIIPTSKIEMVKR